MTAQRFSLQFEFVQHNLLNILKHEVLPGQSAKGRITLQGSVITF